MVNDEHNFRVTAAVVASALMMQNIDGTIVATALPSMARDLNVNPVYLSSAITSYLIALTAFIPISGWVADRYGAKRVFMAAIATFTIASLLCAISTSFAGLIAARVLQGVGGAMMVPVGRLILFRRVRREQLLSATTWLTMPALLGPVLGPPLGGFLTDALSWHSVFWVNVPLGIVGLALSWWLIPRSEPARAAAPDLVGMALIGLSLSVMMLGIETIGRSVLPDNGPAWCLGAGLALMMLAVRHCRRVPKPAVDFSLLSIPTFNAATVSGSLFRAGAGALPFLVPLTLQVGLGMSASASGMIAVASALGSFCMRPMTAFALRLLSVRAVLITGSVAFAATLAACTMLSSAWPAGAIFALLLAGGLSRSLSFASMGAVVFADVPPDKLSAATSLQGTAQQLMKAVGVAVAGGSMQVTMRMFDHPHAEPADFACAFTLMALIVIASCPMFARLSPHAGAGISATPRRSA